MSGAGAWQWPSGCHHLPLPSTSVRRSRSWSGKAGLGCRSRRKNAAPHRCQGAREPGEGASRRDVLGGAATLAMAGSQARPARAESIIAPMSAERRSMVAHDTLEERVKEFTLSDGLHVIVLERRTAPVISCCTYADVGACDEEDGRTGIAHLLEHLAFKGTSTIGTKDYQKERALLSAMDETFYELREAEKQRRADDIKKLKVNLDKLVSRASTLVVPNEIATILQREGGVGLNAMTSQDSTRYYVSLPSNKLELWFALESARFQDPVFRDFFKEKAVVLEERRQRVEVAPLGKFQEAFAFKGFKTNYRRPVIGYESDIRNTSRRDVEKFFKKFYNPHRLTLAVVGDVDAERVEAFANKYWGAWVVPTPSPSTAKNTSPDPAAGSPGPATATATPGTGQSASGTSSPAPAPPPASAPVDDDEVIQDRKNVNDTNPFTPSEMILLGSTLGTPPPPPPKQAVQCLRWESDAGPLFMAGYYRPPAASDDSIALQVTADVLSGGRSSRLYSNLIARGQSLSASVVPSYPGEKRQSMFLTVGVPPPDQRLEQQEALLKEELARLVESGPTERELNRVKKGSRISLLEVIGSNLSMAQILCQYHAITGSWRGLLRDLDAIDSMTAQRVKEVAGRTFSEGNKFSGYVSKPRGGGTANREIDAERRDV